MPILPFRARNSRLFYVDLTRFATALGVGEPVLEWGWEVSGLRGWVIAILAAEDTPDTPISNVTRRVLRQKLYSLRDIKDFFLSSIPDDKFDRAYVWYDELNAYIDLNTEEE